MRSIPFNGFGCFCQADSHADNTKHPHNLCHQPDGDQKGNHIDWIIKSSSDMDSTPPKMEKIGLLGVKQGENEPKSSSLCRKRI
jgi:hypothetical protein